MVHGAPAQECATVAGLVLDVLGRVPEAPGDRVTVAGRTIEVLAVAGRAITEVRVGPACGDTTGVSRAETSA